MLARSPYGTDLGSVATDCFLEGAGVDLGVAFGVGLVDLLENNDVTLPKNPVFFAGAIDFVLTVVVDWLPDSKLVTKALIIS